MNEVLELLETIKNGVIAQNWEMVCLGYNKLTGENLTPPKLTPLEALVKLRQEKGNIQSVEVSKSQHTKVAVPSDVSNSDIQLDTFGNDISPKKRGRKKKVKKPIEELKNTNLVDKIENNTTTDISICDNTIFADGKDKGTVKARQPVFIDAATLFKSDPKYANEVRTTIEKDVQEQAKLKESFSRITRPATQLVKIQCSKCNKEFEISPSLYPTKIAADDETPKWRCNNCAKKPS